MILRCGLVVIILSFFMVACTRHYDALDPKVQYQRNRLANDLAENRIQVSEIGHDITITLATEELFHAHSTHFTRQSRMLFNKLQQLLATYQAIGVSLTAYTNELCTLEDNRALAYARAKQIAQQLWEHWDARMLAVSADGRCGGQQTAYERRIEIKFRAVSA